ncbi:transmembrane protein, partial [Clarias magur]
MVKSVCILWLVPCQELYPVPGGALFITRAELTFSFLHHREHIPPACDLALGPFSAHLLW